MIIVGFIAIKPAKIKAAEPLTMAFIVSGIIISVSASLVLAGVYTTADLFLRKSKNKKDYERRHTLFEGKSKTYFLDTIDALKNNADIENAELRVLSNHELYRYPKFRAAIKESCSEYSDYIKKIIVELANDRKKRDVQGFNVTYKSKKSQEDIFEFYELIKALHQEILAEEGLVEVLRQLILNGDYLAINEQWDLFDQELLCQVLRSVGMQENNRVAYDVLVNLFNVCQRESAELRYLAFSILFNVLPSSLTNYQEALNNLRKALEIEPHNQDFLNALLIFNMLPEKLVDDNEAQIIRFKCSTIARA